MFDFLFPRTCVGCGTIGTYFCSTCSPGFSISRSICPACQLASIGGVTHSRCISPLMLDGLVSVFRYQGPMQKTIKRLKYRMVRGLVETFVELAISQIHRSSLEFFQTHQFIVTPVPLHPRRLRYRGFNQSSLLGSRFARQQSLVFEEVLARKRHIAPLAELKVGLTREEKERIRLQFASLVQQAQEEKKMLIHKKIRARREATRGIFQVRNDDILTQGKNYLLVDDVWTSGATLLECGKVLKRRGAKLVWGMTFARSRGM